MPDNIGLTVFIVVSVLVAIVGLATTLQQRRGKRGVLAWSEEEWIERQWKFLRLLYERTNGSPHIPVKTTRLRKTLGWDWEATQAVRDTLQSANLLEVKPKRMRELWENLGFVQRKEAASDDLTTELLRITAFGADQVRRNRNSPTASWDLHRTIVQVSGGQGHQIMVDSPGGYQLAQHHFDRSEVQHILNEFRHALENSDLGRQQRMDAQSYLAVAEAELRKAKPDATLLDKVLRTLWSIALGAGGSGLWAGVAGLFARFFQQ
jgi:hypothetical protein